jgi:hypothetical protein
MAMMRAGMRGVVMGGVALVLGLGVTGAGAGADAQEVTVAAGAASYDLSGVGTSWTASACYGHPLAGRVVLEAGATLFGYETQGASDRLFLMPEVGVGVTLPAGPVAFVLSAGGGLSAAVKGDEQTDATLHAALALDLPAAGRLALRPGVRYRAVDPWAGTVFEYTLGVRFAPGR